MPLVSSFDVDPETTPIKVPGPLVQRLELHAGDDLPGFAAIVEDDLGNPVDLTGARAYFCLSDGRGRWIVRRQCFIANPAAGVVTFDWSSNQTYTWGVGSHPLAILVRWPDGREFTAPSQKSSVTFEIRPSSEYPLPAIPPLPGPMTVTITASALQVANAPIEFQVDFSAAADGFTAEDVNLSGTALPTTVTVFGSGAHYLITVSGMTQTGTVTVSIPANIAINAEVAVDIPNEASNVVTVDYLIEHFGYVVTGWGGWTATASSTFIERAATIDSIWGTWLATAGAAVILNQFATINSDWGVPPAAYEYADAAAHSITVPTGVTTATLECWGAGPGAYPLSFQGNGAYIKAIVTDLTPGETLWLYAGGIGAYAGAGGFNGGGACTGLGGSDGCGGNGASDIRRGGNALANRILIGAAGGGGINASGGGNGGPGGYPNGGTGTAYSGHGGPGTQTAGGNGASGATPPSTEAGSLGLGGTSPSGPGGGRGGGGGGGGYYGGGAGISGFGVSSDGGGGSSYYHPSLTLVTAETVGTWAGNGKVRVTFSTSSTVWTATAIGTVNGLFTDDFGRSNRPISGDNGWVADGTATASIVSGQVVVPTSGFQRLTNTNGSISSTNHYGQITVVSGLPTSLAGVIARYQSSTAYYVFRRYAGNWELYKQVGVPFTLIGSLAEALPTLPFKMRLACVGTTLTCSVFASGAWSTKITVTDGQYATGRPGFYGEVVSGTSVVLDDFEAG